MPLHVLGCEVKHLARFVTLVHLGYLAAHECVNVLPLLAENLLAPSGLHREPHVVEKQRIGVPDPTAAGTVGQTLPVKVVVRLDSHGRYQEA